MDSRLLAALDHARHANGLVIALTGAGISAESGIPTFRGKDGYWTVGSTVYHPQELATQAAFRRIPVDVWQWYLYRRTVCRRAQPNLAHHALVRLEQGLGDRFRLITQNVDGLHLRAGQSPERTYQIHGNIDFMRCAGECSPQSANELTPIPDALDDIEAGQALTGDQVELLRCPRCHGRARPHVLWFDESYDEPLFRFQSSIDAANRAALVLVVGTSASTTLPWHVVEIAARQGAALVDINIEHNPFARIAQSVDVGCAVRGSAAEHIPGIVDHLLAA
jgi:NAD-dependent deacetylase